MKKKIWIPIISIICAISLIISYNVMYNIENGKADMKSYDIKDYEVIEIYYDDVIGLNDGVHTENTEGIRKQFDSYNDYLENGNGLSIDSSYMCTATPSYDGGYMKLEINTDNVIISSKDDEDNSPLFGVYNGIESFCSYDKYSKYDQTENAVKTVGEIKNLAEILMRENTKLITDKNKLYEYTTLLNGYEPEKVLVNGKKIYDFVFTKIEFIDQGETRLVKFDYNGVDNDGANYKIDGSMYYKIVLRNDSSEFENDYNEKFEQLKNIPYYVKDEYFE